MNYSNNDNDTPGPLGGQRGFKKYLAKSRKANSIMPETKAYMRSKAGSATNKLMRNRILANYGLSLSVDTKSGSTRYR